MTQGNRNRVRRVVRAGGLFHVQQAAGHVDDLPLFRLAVANHGLLDLHGGVFKNRDVCLGQRQQNHAPPVGDADACGDVVAPEQLLNCGGVRLRHLDQTPDIVVQNLQPLRKGQLLRRGHHAVLQQTNARSVGFQQAEARRCVTGVNAENSHNSLQNPGDPEGIERHADNHNAGQNPRKDALRFGPLHVFLLLRLDVLCLKRLMLQRFSGWFLLCHFE